MYKEFVENISSRFWFTLVFGVFGVIAPFLELRDVLPHYTYYFIAGFCVGLGLGVVVVAVERFRYMRHDLKLPYTTTSLPDVVSFTLLLLTVVVRPEDEPGCATIIFVALGTFLLFLSLVLFRIRNNKKIIVGN